MSVEQNALKELRGELVDTVTGVTTYDHVPGRVALPAAFVIAGSPYIEQGETFGESTVRFGLVLLTHPTLNGQETDDLDALILATKAVLEAEEWRVEGVEQPRIQDLNGTEVLATEIRVAALATL